MKGDVRNTLTLPFENGLLDLPANPLEGVFIDARPLQSSSIDWSQLLTCKQGDKGWSLALQRAG